MTYKTRKEQMDAFARQLVRDLGLSAKATRKQRQIVREAMRSAAMCGAAEERHRTLGFIGDAATKATICEWSVLAVLGYER